MCHLTNTNPIFLERNGLNLCLKTKPSNCILYSEDGAKFEIHKELLGQTKFMREILNSAKGHCCSTLEIICPCTKRELEKLVYFLYNGEIHCEDVFDSYNVQEDLTKIFGYPEFLNLDGQITSFLDDPAVCAVSSILDTAIFESTELTLLSDTDLNSNLIGESNEIDKNFDRIDQSNSNAESFKNTTLRRLKTPILLDNADFKSTEESNNSIRDDSKESKKNPTLDQSSNAFSQKNMLVSYQKKKHLNPKLHACIECQIVFLSKAKLNVHLKIVHEKFEHFSCQFCDRSFLLRIQLRNHQMKEHSNQKKELISNLKSVHEKPIIFKCQYCEKSFESEFMLKRHLNCLNQCNLKRSLNNQKFFCMECGCDFATKKKLHIHMKSVHLKPKPILFKCKYCEKIFKGRFHLKRHKKKVHI
jgi:aspartate carbamoyltransferase regulatory subunit